MPYVHGLPACDCLAEWLPAFEARIGRSPRWFQLVGDAPASAGFHRGGGSADSEPLSEDELRISRNMGGAAWNRWWTDSDGDPNYHAHIRLNGCKHNGIGQPQVDDLNRGNDGTGPLWDTAGTPDNGPRDGVHWPLRTWRQGIDWANEQEDNDMASEESIKQIVAALRPVIAEEVAKAVASNKVDVGRANPIKDDRAFQLAIEAAQQTRDDIAAIRKAIAAAERREGK